jgi:ribulose-5-phosphate 4-epimerase/fuculose-1-phosphate aldolase
MTFGLEQREDVIRAALTASREGLMPANQGNLSIRDQASGLILITPHDRPYDRMSPEDLVVIDGDGTVIEGDLGPSYDVPVHTVVYRERPDVNAVIHTEPAFVNAFGAVEQDIDPVTTTGLKSANGSVPIMPFSAVRDAAFARDMLAMMGDRHAIVWGSHGLLVIGSDLGQVLDRSLGIEFNARVLAIARSLGTPNSLAYLDAAMIKA